jgi:hypothetical protein
MTAALLDKGQSRRVRIRIRKFIPAGFTRLRAQGRPPSESTGEITGNLVSDIPIRHGPPCEGGMTVKS